MGWRERWEVVGKIVAFLIQLYFELIKQCGFQVVYCFDPKMMMLDGWMDPQ